MFIGPSYIYIYIYRAVKIDANKYEISQVINCMLEMYIYICIYIYRERERERHTYLLTYILSLMDVHVFVVCSSMCVCVIFVDTFNIAENRKTLKNSHKWTNDVLLSRVIINRRASNNTYSNFRPQRKSLKLPCSKRDTSTFQESMADTLSSIKRLTRHLPRVSEIGRHIQQI